MDGYKAHYSLHKVSTTLFLRILSKKWLAGLFIAFDIYDMDSKKFLSTTERNSRLADCGIPVVPTVATGHFTEVCGNCSFLNGTGTTYCNAKSSAISVL